MKLSHHVARLSNFRSTFQLHPPFTQYSQCLNTTVIAVKQAPAHATTLNRRKGVPRMAGMMAQSSPLLQLGVPKPK